MPSGLSSDGNCQKQSSPQCIRSILLSVLLCCALTGVTFAAEPSLETLGPTEPIKIGISCVLSGPSAALGSNLLVGSKAWFDRVNATGGIHGRQVALVIKDDSYEPDPAVINTQALIAD